MGQKKASPFYTDLSMTPCKKLDYVRNRDLRLAWRGYGCGDYQYLCININISENVIRMKKLKLFEVGMKSGKTRNHDIVNFVAQANEIRIWFVFKGIVPSFRSFFHLSSHQELLGRKPYAPFHGMSSSYLL